MDRGYKNLKHIYTHVGKRGEARQHNFIFLFHSHLKTISLSPSHATIHFDNLNNIISKIREIGRKVLCVCVYVELEKERGREKLIEVFHPSCISILVEVRILMLLFNSIQLGFLYRTNFGGFCIYKGILIN